MYIPPSFREERLDVLHDVIRKHSFGTLVSQHDGTLIASHLPFLLRPDAETPGVLLGHMARANPQWRDFHSGTEVLALFQGPHGYISPSWYEMRETVPTWNYEVVHAYGVATVIEDPTAVRAMLDATVAVYEAALPEPWSTNRVSGDLVDKLQRAIVGFEIRITRLEGKRKLSQNRSEADQHGVLEALRRTGAHDLANLMEEVLGLHPKQAD